MKTINALIVALGLAGFIGCGSSSSTTTSSTTTAISNTTNTALNVFALSSDSLNLSLTDDSIATGALVLQGATIDAITVECPGSGDDVTVTGDVTQEGDADGGGTFDLSADLNSCFGLTGSLAAAGSYTESGTTKVATTSNLSGSLTDSNNDCVFSPASGTVFSITIVGETVTASTITGTGTSTCGSFSVTCEWDAIDITDTASVRAACTASVI